MWLIVETDRYKERETLELLRKVEGFRDGYLPMCRKTVSGAEGAKCAFVPLISHVLFVDIDVERYKTDFSRQRYHSRILTNRGYFLYYEDTTASDGTIVKQQIKTDARLFCVRQEGKSLDDLLSVATIDKADVEGLRLFVDQANSSMTDYQVIDADYDLLASTHDTVLVTEGPYRGFRGVVRQRKTRGKKDRVLYVRVANWCFCIPNIRAYRYVVVHEAPHGKKSAEVNAWRNADMLIGRFQALLPTDKVDNAAHYLRTLLLRLHRGVALGDLETKLQKDTTNPDTPLLLLFLRGDEIRGIGPLSAAEAGAVISLSRHYRSVESNIEFVLREAIPDRSLRPFLTPTPGTPIPEGQDYAVVPHATFTEYIIPLNLRPYFWRDEYEQGKFKTFSSQAGDYIYYAHVGVKEPHQTPSNPIQTPSNPTQTPSNPTQTPSNPNSNPNKTLFISCGTFSRMCEQGMQRDSESFLADLRRKGYESLATLLTDPTITFYEDKESGIHGFVMGLKGFEMGLKGGAKGFEIGLKEFDMGLNELEMGLKEFEMGLKEFEMGLKEFEWGSKGFEWGSKGFENGLRGLKEFENGLNPTSNPIQTPSNPTSNPNSNPISNPTSNPNSNPIQTLIGSFVSVWQGTRNLELRNALRKDVLLHKQVLDEVENKVPMNEALERVFDAVGGEARSMEDIHADLIKYVGTIESHLASHRFLPAYVLYLQILQTVSRRYLSDDRETLCPRSAYLPDKACTAAHTLITTYIADNTDEVTKEIIEEYRPIIKHLRKSPSFLAFRIPSCL